MKYHLYKVIIITIILNLILPFIFKYFANRNEMNPPKGIEKLSYKGQFMNMMYNKNRTKIVNIIYIIIIIILSLELSKFI
jgi:hypothetical protein